MELKKLFDQGLKIIQKEKEWTLLESRLINKLLLYSTTSDRKGLETTIKHCSRGLRRENRFKEKLLEISKQLKMLNPAWDIALNKLLSEIEIYQRILVNKLSVSWFGESGTVYQLIHTPLLNKDKLEAELTNLNQIVIPSLLTCLNNISRFYYSQLMYIKQLSEGNTPNKYQLPPQAIPETEVKGPVVLVLPKIKERVELWGRMNNFRGKIWIAGSLLDGFSSVKSLFDSERKFFSLRPVDYKDRISDLDIGIELPPEIYKQTVPLHLQRVGDIKGRVSFVRLLEGLSSDALTKKVIIKYFGPKGKPYVELIDSLTGISIDGIKLGEGKGDREITIKFFSQKGGIGQNPQRRLEILDTYKLYQLAA